MVGTSGRSRGSRVHGDAGGGTAVAVAMCLVMCVVADGVDTSVVARSLRPAPWPVGNVAVGCGSVNERRWSSGRRHGDRDLTQVSEGVAVGLGVLVIFNFSTRKKDGERLRAGCP